MSNVTPKRKMERVRKAPQQYGRHGEGVRFTAGCEFCKNAEAAREALAPLDTMEADPFAAIRSREQGEPAAWQPIETAPKDGTQVLGMSERVYAPVVRLYSPARPGKPWDDVPGVDWSHGAEWGWCDCSPRTARACRPVSPPPVRRSA